MAVSVSGISCWAPSPAGNRRQQAMISFIGERPLDYLSGNVRWKGEFQARFCWIPGAMLRSLETGTRRSMHKLVPVEDAKTLFNEAKDWSVWRWLIEKKHARTTADAAWEALEACEEKVKAGWAEEWRQAYLDLSANGRPKARRHASLDPELK